VDNVVSFLSTPGKTFQLQSSIPPMLDTTVVDMCSNSPITTSASDLPILQPCILMSSLDRRERLHSWPLPSAGFCNIYSHCLLYILSQYVIVFPLASACVTTLFFSKNGYEISTALLHSQSYLYHFSIRLYLLHPTLGLLKWVTNHLLTLGAMRFLRIISLQSYMVGG